MDLRQYLNKYNHQNIMKTLQFRNMVTLGFMLSICMISYGQLNYKTTWIANSGGKSIDYVQMYMVAAAVNPTGNTVGVCSWDEGGRGLGLYGTETGSVLNKEWNNRNGGTNVGINRNFLYNGGGSSIAKRPLTNTAVTNRVVNISGISVRFNQGDIAYTLKPAAADSFRIMMGITGISANESYVAVAVYQLNKVFVYDTDLNLLRTISVDRAYYATPDNSGNVWVIQGTDRNNAPKISEFNASGNATGKVITGFADPRSLQVNEKGLLIVGDNGTNQQVYFYDITGTPVLVETFGQKGGNNAGIPGQVLPDKFTGIVYAGTDELDNLYVVTNCEGSIIRKFDKDRNLVWQKFGLAFVDMADVDPYNENDIYSCEERYFMDYSKENGQEQEYKAYTYNYDKYPDDARNNQSVDGGVWIRRINGKKFMFAGNMYSGFIAIYRFNEETDGEIAIPSGLIIQHQAASPDPLGRIEWPPKQPRTGTLLWRDKNGDGQMEESEYETSASTIGFANVDEAGNIYIGNNIDYFECQGLDEVGNPIYSFKNIVRFSIPEPYSNIKKAVYDNKRDILYTSGNSKSLRNDHNVGPVFAAYPNWSKGNRVATWVKSYNLAYGGFGAKGEYVFAAYAMDEGKWSVDVYSAKDGAKVGNLAPTGLGQLGWIDIPWGLNVAQRNNGEYLVFREDDLYAKTVLYRWNPYENDNQYPTKPNSLKFVSKTSTSVTVSFDHATDETGLSGYYIYANGVKSNVQTVWNTTYTITGLNPDSSYDIYVAAVDYAGHETNSDNINVVTYPVDNINPSKPTGFSAQNVTLSTINLKWNSATDNIGVVGYNLFLNDEKIGFKMITDTVYRVTNLLPSTQYNFKLVACDYAGNSSEPVSIAVSTSADNQVPSTPVLYPTTQRSSSEIAINWRVSTDNSGIAYYDLYNKGVLLKGKIPAHEYLGIPVEGDYMLYKVTGLEANTSYEFTLKAVDLGGNESGFSNKLVMSTESVWSRLLDIEEAKMGIGYTFYYGNNIDISGFIMGSMQSGYMEWTVDLPIDTLYRFITHYTTEETFVYPMQIDVNGEKVAEFQLKRLTNMTWWGYEDDPNYVIVRLKAGKSLIRLTSRAQWAPGLDLLKVLITKPFVSLETMFLDKNELIMQKDETVKLNAIIEPVDATDKRLVWSSNKKSVAKVDTEGLVTAVSNGTATITVVSEDGKKTASCVVTVGPNAVNDTGMNDLVTVFPNPARDELFVKFPDLQGNDDVVIRLYNSLSSQVLSVNATNYEKNGMLRIDTSILPNGIYLLQTTIRNRTVDTQKIVISK